MKVGRRRAPYAQTSVAAAAKLPRRPDLLSGEKLGRIPLQQRSRARRDALLKAALELFGRNGYEATAIGDIARNAHTSVGAFYQYFQSKRQILIVLMNELLAKLEHVEMQPQGARDLRSGIESVLRAGLATDLAYAGAYRAWQEAILSDRVLAELDERVRSWTRGRLCDVFMMLARLAGARAGIDVSLFAAVMDRLFWDLLASALKSDPGLIEILGHMVYCSLFHDTVPSAGSE